MDPPPEVTQEAISEEGDQPEPEPDRLGKRKRKDKQFDRVADRAPQEDVGRYVRDVDRKIPIVKLQLDRDRTKGQIRILNNTRVDQIYASLLTNPPDSLQRVLLWEGDVLGMSVPQIAQVRILPPPIL